MGWRRAHRLFNNLSILNYIERYRELYRFGVGVDMTFSSRPSPWRWYSHLRWRHFRGQLGTRRSLRTRKRPLASWIHNAFTSPCHLRGALRQWGSFRRSDHVRVAREALPGQYVGNRKHGLGRYTWADGAQEEGQTLGSIRSMLAI